MATPARSLPRRIPPGPGQESVWDYPRPPRVERCARRIRVEFAGEVVADTRRAWRVLETSHPPVYYVPLEDVRMDRLERASGGSYCEWKGRAVYFDVVAGGRRAERAAWAYPSPVAAFRDVKDCLAFYPAAMDACWVDGEQARPQPGGFYGGWVTDDVVGPFKGEPGSWGW
jgi:uncharacterized protein (DUF427 family)